VKADLVAEFDAPEPLARAIVALRRRGYRAIDAFTPYPLKAIDAALGLRRSPISWLLFPIWTAAAAGAYFVQWWCNAYDYPLDVGGRPPHSAPAFVPITFEMGVLGAAVGSILLFLALAGLPRLYHPVFTTDGFERATDDRFFLGVDATDPAFDSRELAQELSKLGALRVSFAEEQP
jgi:hypothetical protein